MIFTIQEGNLFQMSPIWFRDYTGYSYPNSKNQGVEIRCEILISSPLVSKEASSK